MGEKKPCEEESGRCIGNIRGGREEKLYALAAKTTGFHIKIYPKAYDFRGTRILGFSSIWTQEPLGRDHEPLFKEAARLRQIENS